MLKLNEVTAVEPIAIADTEKNDNANSEKLTNPENLKDEVLRGCSTYLNSIIQNCWNLIDEINGFISTLDYEFADGSKNDAKEILNSITDDITIDIGMLYKAISMFDEKRDELIDAGESKAEEILSDNSESGEESDAAVEEE